MPRLVPDQRSGRVTGHRRGHFRTFRLELVNLAPDNFKNGCVVQKLQPSLVGRFSLNLGSGVWNRTLPGYGIEPWILPKFTPT